MKPFFTNEILFKATYEELSILRVALVEMRNKKLLDPKWTTDPDLKEELDKYNQLYRDLTNIIDKIPF